MDKEESLLVGLPINTLAVHILFIHKLTHRIITQIVTKRKERERGKERECKRQEGDSDRQMKKGKIERYRQKRREIDRARW